MMNEKEVDEFANRQVDEATAGMSDETKMLTIHYTAMFTELAYKVMVVDANKLQERMPPLLAMIAACKVMLVGLEKQRQELEKGD